MKCIYKYPLELTDRQEIEMPSGAQMLSVQFQGGLLCLWALVHKDRSKATVVVRIFGTRNPAEDADSVEYVGTVQLNGLVWHVFVQDTHQLV